MANNLDSMMADVMEEVATLMGETVTISGASYVGFVDPVEYMEELETGGLAPKRGLRVIVRRELFAVTPTLGSLVLYESTRYRVHELNKDGVAYEFVLKGDNE